MDASALAEEVTTIDPVYMIKQIAALNAANAPAAAGAAARPERWQRPSEPEDEEADPLVEAARRLGASPAITAHCRRRHTARRVVDGGMHAMHVDWRPR